MDPFRLGIMIIAIAAAAMMLAVALPAILQTLLQFAPTVAILAFVFWILRGMIGKLLS